MNAGRNNKNFDELIAKAISRDRPKFDFDRWKQTYEKEVDIFESQKEPAKPKPVAFKPNIQRTIFLSKVGYVAAALLVVSSLVACFVLSGKINDLRKELAQAQRDVALAQQNVTPAQPDDTTTINFYLEEHRDLVAQQASMNSTTSQPAQIRVSQQDIMYYESFDDGPEYMSPGIIVRRPSTQLQTGSTNAPTIANGHTLTLSEARKTAGFMLVSRSWLHPGYKLDEIRRIEGRDALQLLYTDGINSVSLFEQPLDGQRGLGPKDFREYAVYRNKEQAGGTILAWKDDNLSYVLIGNIEMSLLMDIAQSISAVK
ncbi:MAG: hypothetical protein P8Z79_00160 [Sedimentisphaerales bacterium]|jgi:hypothetical protein